MPTYDYRCDACEHTFELFQGMRDSVKRTCPKCKARKLKRLIGTGAAILIGGRSSSPEPHSEPKNESQSDASSSDSTSSSGDSKTTGNEKKMSGSTSTPTHEAREHRGIGNLVDAAKRTRSAEKTKKTPESSAKSGSKKSEKKSVKKSSKPTKAPSKKTTKSTRSRTPRTGK